MDAIDIIELKDFHNKRMKPLREEETLPQILSMAFNQNQIMPPNIKLLSPSGNFSSSNINHSQNVMSLSL